jgi:hypothetical protein
MKERFIFIWTANEMNKAKTILGGWLSQTHTQGVGNKMLYKYTRKTSQNVQNILGNKPEIRYPNDGHVGEA